MVGSGSSKRERGLLCQNNVKELENAHVSTEKKTEYNELHFMLMRNNAVHLFFTGNVGYTKPTL